MGRKHFAVIAAAAVALWAPTVTRAHEGGVDARGIVKAVSSDTITISTRHGDEVFALTPRTRFVVGKRQVTRADVSVGDRAVVHAKPGAPPEAVEVKGAARAADGGRR